CAPAFHQPAELNDAYLSHTVKDRSLWIRPSWIGPLPDDRDHYIAFRHPGPCIFRSEGEKPITPASAVDVRIRLQDVLAREGELRMLPDRLQVLAEHLAEIAEQHPTIPHTQRRETRERLADRNLVERIAFYSHVYLDAQFFLVQLQG